MGNTATTTQNMADTNTELEETLEMLEKLALNPQQVETKLGLAKITESLETKKRDEPSLSDYILARAYFLGSRDAEAYVLFGKSIKNNIKVPESYHWQGMIHRYANEHTKALECLQKATELDPNNSTYLLQAGLVLQHGLKDYDKATESFKKAIAVDPKEKGAFYGIASCCASKKDTEGAIENWKKAAEIDPKYLNAWYNLGTTYQTNDKPNEAVEAFLKVVEINPSDWNAVAKIIQLYQKLGKVKERDEWKVKIFDLYTAGKVNSPKYCREQMKNGENELVLVYEFFDIMKQGPNKIKYAWIVTENQRQKYRISLGSYDMTNAMQVELGMVGEGERCFHLDGYYVGGRHSTFGFYKGEPSYDSIREKVVSILKGESEMISGSTIPNAEYVK